MTEIADGNCTSGPAEDLVVVHVTDAINQTLAGHGDISYQSPPLPPDEARTLVRLLVGHGQVAADEGHWTRPIAGGQRTVTLRPAAAVARAATS
jgi:hypothetical protein